MKYCHFRGIVSFLEGVENKMSIFFQIFFNVAERIVGYLFCCGVRIVCSPLNICSLLNILIYVVW